MYSRSEIQDKPFEHQFKLPLELRNKDSFVFRRHFNNTNDISGYHYSTPRISYIAPKRALYEWLVENVGYDKYTYYECDRIYYARDEVPDFLADNMVKKSHLVSVPLERRNWIICEVGPRNDIIISFRDTAHATLFKMTWL